MTVSTYSPLPRRCPIGFRFEWDRDSGDGHVREYALAGWFGATPLFSDGDEHQLWSGRLETVAAEAYRCSLR